MNGATARRGLLIALPVAAAVGIALAVPGVVARSGVEAALADTSVISSNIDFFSRRFAEDPWSYLVGGRLVGALMLRFRNSANLADVVEAERVARAVVRAAPDRAGALARVSAVVLAQHKFGEAYSIALEAVQINPSDDAVQGTLFDAAMAAGRYALAESTLAHLSSSTLEGQLRRAHWFNATGHQEAALSAMDRACWQIEQTGLRPQVIAWCLTELAKMRLGKSGARGARPQFERALALQPGYRGAVEGLADLAHAKRDWKLARRLYASIAADAHPDLYLRLAETAIGLSDSEAARRYEAMFLRVATVPDAEALYAHPLALYYASRPETRYLALAVSLRDIARRPTVESYDVLSWVHFARGEYDDALTASTRARGWGAPSATMDFHRAQILLALGKEAEARALEGPVLARPETLEPQARGELWRTAQSSRVAVGAARSVQFAN